MEESKMPVIKNVYNVKVQKTFFVDEAHRSYNIHGEFFKNLMTCDSNGIYIAMTGTPLLTKKERSNLKFGDYIHKYFYDKSIAVHCYENCYKCLQIGIYWILNLSIVSRHKKNV